MMETMDEYTEHCPFCGKDYEQRVHINIICNCGAKYYFHDNVWLDRKTGLREQGACFHNCGAIMDGEDDNE
jgi:hypothetical protein